MYSWSSWRTLVPLIVGVAGLAAFVVYETTVPSRPLIPMKIFQHGTVVFNHLACLLHGIILWCMLYYLPLYYESALGYKAVIAGAAILPLTLTIAPLSAVTSILISVTGKYRWALWSGWSVSTLGLGLLYLLDSQTTVSQWIFITVVPGLGLGVLFSSMMLAVQASADPQFISITAAMAAFFRSLGQTVGVAIGGVVFQNRIHKEFLDRPLLAGMADSWTQDAASLVQYIQSLPQNVMRGEMESAYADALGIVWLVLCGAAGLGLVSCFFVKGSSMDQEFQPAQGMKDAEKEKGTEMSETLSM